MSCKSFGDARAIPGRRTAWWAAILLSLTTIYDGAAFSAEGTLPPGQRQKTLFLWNGSTPAPETDELSPIVTDRPSFTEASNTVGAGVLQIESGYTFTHDDENGIRKHTHSWGEALLRYGMLEDWIELRLGLFPLTQYQTRETPVAGLSDVYLGAKLALTEQAGWLPEMAIMPQMFVPSGDSHFSRHKVLPGINWLYGWDVTDRLWAAGSTQINKAIEDASDRPYFVFAQSWAAGFAFTSQLEVYAEWYGLMPSGALESLPEHYFNAGFTFRLTDDIQWDIRAGMGLNEAAGDFFTGTGLSLRFR